ncbi:MAG: serine/threonine protein kinase [Acidobacteria bacterium]|nr:serine/threonine protein kinase [Acidobacteriota bacterium]
MVRTVGISFNLGLNDGAGLNIGDVIERRWQIMDVLQDGGMGIVYKVYDKRDKYYLAAKTYKGELFAQDTKIAENFVKEALVWVGMSSHPHIINARFVREIEGKPYVFSEFIEGGSLRRWIGKPVLTHDLRQVVQFAVNFCNGVLHARSQGLTVHGDIKPENCLIGEVSRAGEVVISVGLVQAPNPYLIKISDFGLAKSLSDHLNTESEPEGVEESPGNDLDVKQAAFRWVGTPQYMAPEQLSTLTDKAVAMSVRSDIYSFGVMLFEMVTGKLPFEGQTVSQLLLQHTEQTLPALIDSVQIKRKRTPKVIKILRELNDVIVKCLDKNPSRRFEGFEDVQNQLEAIYEGAWGPLPKFISPEMNTARINRGYSLIQLGRFEEAITLLKAVLENQDEVKSQLPDILRTVSDELDDNGKAHIMFNIGVAYEELGHHDEALNYYNLALDLKPDFEMVWVNKGNMLGDSPEAGECFDEALRLDPDDIKALVGKGIYLLHHGDAEQAVACFSRSLEIEPRDTVVLYNMVDPLLHLGRYEEALDHAERLLSIDPSDAQGWGVKGLSLRCLQRYPEALQCFERAIELDSDSELAWTDRGAVLLDLEEYDEAFKSLERVIELKPDSYHSWFNKGLALYNSNRYEEAITYIDRSIEIDSRRASAWNIKGLILSSAGRYPEAIECFESAIELDPEDSTLCYNQGIAILKLSEVKDLLNWVACHWRILNMHIG